MRIHYIQHEPFETPGYLIEWMRNYGKKVTHTMVYLNEPFPPAEEVDMLIIMGGSMGANDDALYPWMIEEKKFIKQCVQQHTKILGICLGAQLIAHTLGARVYPNPHKEIGWFTVHKCNEAKNIPLLKNIPDAFLTMHWHGDTFELPENCTHLFYSEACTNQAFLYDNHVLALQFHPEMLPESIHDMILSDPELREDTFVQKPENISKNTHKCAENNEILHQLLHNFMHLS